jgi:hypothetical protein
MMYARTPTHTPDGAMTKLLAALLLLGTLCFAAGAAAHPMLHGDAAAQLRTIADTGAWRAIHLLLLAGSGLIIAGLWTRFVGARDVDAAAQRALLVALAVITVGQGINAIDTAYMTSAGWKLGALFASGDPSAVALYGATHPIGRIVARFGNFVVAIGAVVLGWVEWRDAFSPRWLAWLAAAGGLAGALFFDEESPMVLAAVALLCGWQVATGLRALAQREAP